MRNLIGGGNTTAEKQGIRAGISIMRNWPCALLVWVSCSATGAAANEASPTAAFRFAFDDTSLQGQIQGVDPAEQRRLVALDAQLRDLLAGSGCCSIVDLRAVAEQAQGMAPRTCNGCDIDLARKVGARISVTGWVQKVSNLILNINLVARDVATGQVIGAGSVDIRGNTDESWSRGLSYLLRNRLHPSEWR
jgi:hypothetical protein